MKVLVVGGGGREHALVWKISQSKKVQKVYCAPGNAGIQEMAHCVPIKATDIKGLLAFAKDKQIDITVVGPEAPLAEGIADSFEEEGLAVFGPGREAACFESSKIFAKEFMDKYNIPTAGFNVFEDHRLAKDYILENLERCVVKADGLAAGKGVYVAGSKEEALDAVDKIMVQRAFGNSGDRIVIEELLVGEEVSILAFVDGHTLIPMVSSQDHKAIFDGDIGPNTGGMGAYSPAPIYTEAIHEQVMETVFRPFMEGLSIEGINYKGIIYAGLMITEAGPMLLEFNVRFGDPETQPILFRLDSDIMEIIMAVVEGRLDEIDIQWSSDPSVCVILASGGYPGEYETGKVIKGLDECQDKDSMIFHGGTKKINGEIVTAGGRVLGITTRATSLQDAVDKAYQWAKKIKFDKLYFRRDIGHKALKRNS